MPAAFLAQVDWVMFEISADGIGKGKGTSHGSTQLNECLSQPWICRLAALTRSGAPAVSPVWFEHAPDRKVFYIVGRKHSGYISHVLVDPRVCPAVDMLKAP